MPRARRMSLWTTLAGAALLGAAPLGASAQDERAVDSYQLSDERVALGGYDPVAYYPEGGNAPRRGDASNSVEHNGVTYLFASSGNAERFQADPDRYEPLYGGWCAWAMARDDRVVPDPEAYSINGNRLFVFYDRSKRNDWLAHIDRDVANANGHWMSFSGGEDEARRLDGLTRGIGKYDLGKKDLAIAGYDPVAYFPEGGAKATKGSKKQTLTFRGATYRFASKENLERFRSNPSRYEPAYGGWCAYAMSQEDYTEINPKTFLIQDGRLLLFYNGLFGNTYKSWNEEGPRKLEPLADAYWQSETGEQVRR